MAMTSSRMASEGVHHLGRDKSRTASQKKLAWHGF